MTTTKNSVTLKRGYYPTRDGHTSYLNRDIAKDERGMVFIFNVGFVEIGQNGKRVQEGKHSNTLDLLTDQWRQSGDWSTVRDEPIPDVLFSALNERQMATIRPVAWNIIKSVYVFCRMNEPAEIYEPKKVRDPRITGRPNVKGTPLRSTLRLNDVRIMEVQQEMAQKLLLWLSDEELNEPIKSVEAAALLAVQHNKPVKNPGWNQSVKSQPGRITIEPIDRDGRQRWYMVKHVIMKPARRLIRKSKAKTEE